MRLSNPFVLLTNFLEIALILAAVLGGVIVISLGMYALLRAFRQKKAWIYAILTPGAAGLALLTLFPILLMFLISLTNMSTRAGGGRDFFVNPDFGLIHLWNNLAFIFENQIYTWALSANLTYSVLQVLTHLFIGFGLALLMNRKLALRPLYRAILALPWAIPPLMAVITWRGEYHYDYGLFNAIARFVGHPPISWEQDAGWASIPTKFLIAWSATPFIFLVSEAALRSFPEEFSEAAEVEGAGHFARLWFVVLPMILPVLAPALLLDFIWTFNNVNAAAWLPGGPTLMVMVIQWFFYQVPSLYGQAATFGVLAFLTLFGIGMALNRALLGPSSPKSMRH